MLPARSLPAVALVCLVVARLVAQSGTDPAAAVFQRGRVLHVDIQMAPQDWREVRLSHRLGNDLGIPTPTDDGYEYRRADVRIDGVPFAQVGVRKKGFVGSVVSTRPSLKIKFDEYVRGQAFSGLDGLTLNNNNQDQTLVQQYLAYDLFARAGVPAPRANFAHVRVNGEDLGVYSNVEAVGRPFLRRVFGNADGVLYESYAGDFLNASFGQILEKSGARDEDRGRLTRLKDLLASPAPLAIADIDALVDLDSFIRMWAAESLMGHWDSYSGNRNNYYVYVHPSTGKLHFIPWGADSIFLDPGPLQTKRVPKSFKAEGILCRRLWEVPEVRARYRTAMRALLDGPWTESRLRAEIASLQGLLMPLSVITPDAARDDNDRADAFITARRAEIEAELREPAPEWPREGADALSPRPFTVSGSFTAPWSANGPADPLAGGIAAVALQLQGAPRVAFSRIGAFATTHTQLGTGVAPIRDRYQNVTLTGLAGTDIWQVSFTIDPFRFEAKETPLPVDLFAVWAIVVRVDMSAAGQPKVSLWGNVGELRLDEAAARPDGTVRGTFTLRGIVAP